MKTLNEIWAAHSRTLMRTYALMFRYAVCPQSLLTFNERGKQGSHFILCAIRHRNEAREYDAAAEREKSSKKPIDTFAPPV